MSFDLYIVPSSEPFLNWTREKWERFFNSIPPPENIQLGRTAYVGLVLEAITHNLEGDVAGSMFPLIMRIGMEESVGWYPDEVPALLDEIERARKSLAPLPINRSTLSYDNDADVRRRISEFHQAYPNRSVENLYDLNFHFLDTLQLMANKALAECCGLCVAY